MKPNQPKVCSPPPPHPVRWVVTVDADVFVTEPYQTAMAAAASVRLPDGTQPAFSACQCVQYSEPEQESNESPEELG